MSDSAQQKVTRAERHRAALAVAKASPTQHVPRHVTRAEVHQQMAGDSAAGRFNSRLAVMITRGVGTMWAAYVFVLISFVSFPQALAAVRTSQELLLRRQLNVENAQDT